MSILSTHSELGLLTLARICFRSIGLTLIWILQAYSNPVNAQFFSQGEDIPGYLDQNRNELLESHKPVCAFALKFGFDISGKSEIRVSVVGGITQAIEPWKSNNHIFHSHFFLPSYQLEVMCFRGGLGSSLLTRQRQRII